MNKLSKNLKQFQLVTFDVTDTLLKFSLPPAVQYAKTAAEFGYHSIDQKKLNKCFSQEFKKMGKKYPNFGNEHRLEYKKWWYELVCNIFNEATTDNDRIPSQMIEKIALKLINQYRTPQCWEKIQGADEIVDKVKSADKTVGIISNFDPSLRDVIQQMNLPNFDFILTSYECGHMKPHQNIFKEALKLCDKSRNSKCYTALHIGNTFETDYIGAHESGWSCLLVSNDINVINDPRLKNESHIHENLKVLIKNLETRDIKW